MRYRFLSCIIIILLFVCPTPSARAQDVIDTLVENSGLEDTEEEQEEVVADTTLTFTSFFASDSIGSFKRAKEFAWTKTLDSLLRLAKGLKSDTFNVDDLPKDPPKAKNKPNENNPDITLAKDDGPSILANPAIKVILWILAGAFILFILYKLFLSQGMLKREKKYTSGEVTEDTEQPAFLSDFERNIQQALKAGNYRLAVRYLYLQSLNKLSQAGHINYSADKTNYQYVREVYNKPYRNDFAALTLNYEYVWYGNFQIDEIICKRLQDDFNQFNRKI